MLSSQIDCPWSCAAKIGVCPGGASGGLMRRVLGAARERKTCPLEDEYRSMVRERESRSRTVHQADCTAILRGCFSAVFGSLSSSTPVRMWAVTPAASMSSEILNSR